MTPKEINEALREPFPAAEVKWKPIVVKGERALAIAFIDARCVMDRLDDVVGAENWQDHYQTLPNGNVECQLTVRFGTEWITKCDTGCQSDQPDEGDRVKAAYSDALKRAAVKFGIGRYLYGLGRGQWVAYDAQRKQLKDTPLLPPHALPKAKHTPASKAALDQAIERLETAAKQGYAAVAAEFKKMTEADRAAIPEADRERIRTAARAVDAAKAKPTNGHAAPPPPAAEATMYERIKAMMDPDTCNISTLNDATNLIRRLKDGNEKNACWALVKATGKQFGCGYNGTVWVDQRQPA